MDSSVQLELPSIADDVLDLVQLLWFSASERKDIFIKMSTDSMLRSNVLQLRGQDAKDLGTMLHDVRSAGIAP